MPISVNDNLPSVSLYENTPDNNVSITDLGKGKKIIIFGVPGAFTPGCSKTHLPGYLSNYEKIKAKGVDEIICISVNDPFVMAAWGEHHNATGKVRMLADTHGQFTEALGLQLDLSKMLGNIRSQRYSLYAEDNKVKILHVEEDGTGLTCSLAKTIVDEI